METTEWKWKTKDGLEMYSKAWLPAGETRGEVCHLHGVGEQIGRNQPNGEALTKAGYLMAGIDQRAFGQSQASWGTPRRSRRTLRISTCSWLKLPGAIPERRVSCTAIAWGVPWC
ncbi:MAG TPA: alpha/beta hydrolase, partial [Anaerolineales bacterium]